MAACSAASNVEEVAGQSSTLRTVPRPVLFRAPAGDRPAARDTTVDGVKAAILPNGRLVTPLGREFDVLAPKPFGLAVSADGNQVATINSGASRFSVTLVTGLRSGASPVTRRIDLDA